MDRVFIEQLEIETIIGIFDWERKVRQKVTFDIEMQSDIRLAAKTDHIDQALDYKDIAKKVIAFVEASEFQLVETLAEKVAQLILTQCPVTWLRLKLSKVGAVRGSKSVGVIIERDVDDV